MTQETRKKTIRNDIFIKLDSSNQIPCPFVGENSEMTEFLDLSLTSFRKHFFENKVKFRRFFKDLLIFNGYK